jgi:hypothetical protein
MHSHHVKQADLYFNTVFTVVPAGFNPVAFGILPQDQHINRKYVVVWADYDSIKGFDDREKWSIWEIRLSDKDKQELVHLPGNSVFGLQYVSNRWPMRQIKSRPATDKED